MLQGFAGASSLQGSPQRSEPRVSSWQKTQAVLAWLQDSSGTALVQLPDMCGAVASSLGTWGLLWWGNGVVFSFSVHVKRK